MFRSRGENLRSTYILIFLNVAFFMLQFQDAPKFARLFGFDRNAVAAGQVWRLFTYQFTQAGHVGLISFPPVLTLFLNLVLLALLSGVIFLGGATIAQQAFQRASDEIAVAQLYGLDTTVLSAQVASDRDFYARALTPAQFASVTADLQQVAAGADHQVGVALSQTHVIAGVAMIYQNHPLSCEEASTSMALTHQGIHVSQDQILAEIGADTRRMYVDGAGRVRWGNPYETFVGNVNGSESNYTGFGTYWPPLVRVAKAHGASLIAYGAMSAATIYARVIAGHPVVAFATWDWAWHPRRDYLSFDGQWIPWIGPVYASHVYVVVGVSPTQVLINDPIRGQYWVGKAAFQAGYSDFGEAIVFA